MPETISVDDFVKRYGTGSPSAESSAAPATMSMDDFQKRYSVGPSFPKGNQPADLPSDLPEKVGKAALTSLPYAGATAATMLLPEVPTLGILGNFALGTAAAGGGAGIGSGLERGIRSMVGLPQPETSFGEDVLEKGVLPEAGGRILAGVISKSLGAYLDPRRMYQSSLKPTGKPIEAGKAVMTGIREGIPTIPEKAANIASQRINALNRQIEGMISGSPADIPPAQYVANIENKLNGLRNKWGADATHGATFVDQIDNFERQFLLQHGNPSPAVHHTPRGPVTIAPEDMTLAELRSAASPLASSDAQAIKKATYNTIRTSKSGAWDSGAHPGLSVQANQEIAKALKEELEQIYPEIGRLNRREGALIGLEDQLLRFSKREMNKQVLPYFVFPIAGGLLGAGAHGAEGAGVGAIAGHLLRTALEDPSIKSRIAIAVDRASRIPAARAVGKALSDVPTDIRVGEWVLQGGYPTIPEAPKTWEEYKQKTGFGQ